MKFPKCHADSRLLAVMVAGALVPFLTACRQDMQDQPRYKPLAASTFFDDGRSARPQVPGTVPRGHVSWGRSLTQGTSENVPFDAFPFPITRRVLERGQERYNIYCTPCHDKTGSGQGLVVERGFRSPPSYHTDRLRNAPASHFYDVISHGFGAMNSYADRVPPNDRWAIVAYIRALQLSQHATINDVPPAERRKLEEAR